MDRLNSQYQIPTILIILLSVLCMQCRSMEYMDAREQVTESFEQSNYTNTVDLLHEFGENGIYREQDEVLHNLEKSIATRYSGDIEQSNRHFDRSEQLIDSLYGKSVTRNLRAFLINDYQLEYSGEDYENVYLNVFKALNYMHLDDLESALIEARRIEFKMRNYIDRHRRVAEEAASEDTTSISDELTWEPGPVEIEHSPLGHYLTTVLFAKTDRSDQARIEHESMLQAFQNHGRDYIIRDSATREKLDKIKEPEQYNTLLVAFSGRSPVKEERRVELPIPDSDLFFTAAFPVLEEFDSAIDHVVVDINNQQQVTLHLVEDMQYVAKKVYQVRQPLIYSRAVIRSFLRAIGASGAVDLVESGAESLLSDGDNDNDLAVAAIGAVAGAASRWGQRGIESADLRSWTTLPGAAHVNVAQLSEGENQVEFRFKNRNGHVIYTDSEVLTIEEEQDDQLKLIESLYWN